MGEAGREGGEGPRVVRVSMANPRALPWALCSFSALPGGAEAGIGVLDMLRDGNYATYYLKNFAQKNTIGK